MLKNANHVILLNQPGFDGVIIEKSVDVAVNLGHVLQDHSGLPEKSEGVEEIGPGAEMLFHDTIPRKVL